MNEPITVTYHLENRERIFDLGQGIHTNRGYILRRQGGKVKPYTGTIRQLIRQALMFFALALLQLALQLVGGFTAGKMALVVVTAFCGAMALYAARASRRSYDKTLALYLERNGQSGTLTIDEQGITERSDTGHTADIHWDEYVACVMCPEAIVILSTRPLLLICSRTEETEREIRRALELLGRDHGIYEVEIKEKRR